MGLDVALGVVILIAAIRGWLQGFVYQAVRLGGLIACVYLADPVRDQAKPHVVGYLPTIQPDLMDRLLWWVAAGLSYVVLVGATTLVLKMTKRPEIPGVPLQRSRNDQFAGFLFGIAKGALIAAFMTFGLQKYALKQIETISWTKDQVKTSWALRLDNQYQPAARVWTSIPVQHLVKHVARMGLPDWGKPSIAAPSDDPQVQPVVQTASRSLTDNSRVGTSIDESQTAPPTAPESTASKARVVDPDLDNLVVEDLKATLETPSRPK